MNRKFFSIESLHTLCMIIYTNYLFIKWENGESRL